ncbi:MAG TPA: NUDIX domain-containing protein [Candidatus Cybelea sp.]|nr:NUDIX domain-containing protein [Candidatus Cybelea sp.]
MSMNAKDDVEVLSRDTVFQGFYAVDRVRLRHRAFAGGWGRPIVREVLRTKSAVAVLPYDPVRDVVILVEEFRAGPFVAGDAVCWPYAVVAGMVEPGEALEDVARREAMEEAGCRLAGPIEHMFDYYPSPGCSSERVTLFCAQCNSSGLGGVHGLPQEGEDIRVLPMVFDDALDLLRRGAIKASPAIIALQWLALNRADLRRRWSSKEA